MHPTPPGKQHPHLFVSALRDARPLRFHRRAGSAWLTPSPSLGLSATASAGRPHGPATVLSCVVGMDVFFASSPAHQGQASSRRRWVGAGYDGCALVPLHVGKPAATRGAPPKAGPCFARLASVLSSTPHHRASRGIGIASGDQAEDSVASARPPSPGHPAAPREASLSGASVVSTIAPSEGASTWQRIDAAFPAEADGRLLR